jgi:hypothetical protein
MGNGFQWCLFPLLPTAYTRLIPGPWKFLLREPLKAYLPVKK